jgi:hypothetical protein
MMITKTRSFYRENKITPTHLFLLSYSERKDYEELRSKIRLTILKTERIRALFKTQEEIKAMSEQMLFFMSLTGKNISPRQRRACLNISLNAQLAEEAALQSLASVHVHFEDGQLIFK